MTEQSARTGRRRWLLVAAVPALAVAWIGWTLTHAGDPLGFGSRAYAANGIFFAYPASWDRHDQVWPHGTIGSTVAVLGTQPWGLCLPTDINCHYEQRLGAGQIAVDVSVAAFMFDFCDVGATGSDLDGRGPNDPPATRTLLRVDGRPALQTDYDVGRKDYYGSDEWRSWTIAVPGRLTGIVGIEARYQGPDVATFRRQLDELVASLRFTEPPVNTEQPDDCGPPFP